MKILQVCNKPPYPARDGGSLAMFNLAYSINQHGHQITVLTMSTEKHSLSDKQLLEFSNIMPVRRVTIKSNVSIPGLLRNLLFSEWPYTASRFCSTVFDTELIHLLQSEPYDIIQLEGLYLTPYIHTIRKYSNALIALRAHNVEYEIWDRIAINEKNKLRKKYFSSLAKRLKKFESNMINSYDLLIPITNRDLSTFNKMGNKRAAHVCPAGTSMKMNYTDVTNTLENNSGFSVFFLGSLDWIPNQEGLLWFIFQVFPLIQKRFPDLKLHVAGRNAPDSLIRKIKQPGVVYYGEILDADDFMTNHTVMIAPCFSGSGMRLKIIEAMSHAKPIVTTSIGAEGLSVVNDENIMIADTNETFYASIERLILNRDICRKIGYKAFEFVSSHYNNMDIASSLLNFYKKQLP